MKETFIYALSCPLTSNVRYIGKTNNLNKRLSSHLCKSNLKKTTHKNNWINSLLNKNMKPIISILDIVPIDEWEFWEKFWIELFKTWGIKLTNSTNGGDFVQNVIKFGRNNQNYNHNISDNIILKHIKNGLSQKEIANLLKTNVAMIKRRMKNYNIDFIKLRGERITKGNTHNYRNDINYDTIKKYINDGFSINKIAKILNTDRSTIKNRINNEKQN